MTSSTRATSSTVRQAAPLGSLSPPPPIMPSRLISPWVCDRPTLLLSLDGIRIEGPPSSEIAQVTRLAATDDAEPPLEPPTSRAVSYGLHMVPPNALRLPEAYSPRLDFARMIAPASRRRFTRVAS